MDTGKLLADLPDEEIKDIVDKWRNTNPKIRNLWYSFNDAAIRVIQNGGSLRVRCCTFARECDCIRGTTCMTISLPSGRKLYYVEPAVGENRWGGPSITYMGVNDKTSGAASKPTVGNWSRTLFRLSPATVWRRPSNTLKPLGCL